MKSILAIVGVLLMTMECTAFSSSSSAPVSSCYDIAQMDHFEWTNSNKRLSVQLVDGTSVLLAEATRGDALIGIFQGNIQRKDKIKNPWVDVSEVKFTNSSKDEYVVLSFKLIYLPMNHILTNNDLALSDDWEIFSYWFDYDRNKSVYAEKTWQIAVKSKKTSDTRTFIASDVEKNLQKRCHDLN